MEELRFSFDGTQDTLTDVSFNASTDTFVTGSGAVKYIGLY